MTAEPPPIEILLVEDDRDQRESLAEVLEQEGYRVIQAANGQAALAALRDGSAPAVIVLDMIMPVMNGWQFCEVQKSDPALARIPVVALSSAVKKDRQSPYYAEVDEIVPKPVVFRRLLSTIRSLVVR